MKEFTRKEIKVKAVQFKVDKKPWPFGIKVGGIWHKKEGAGKYGEDTEARHWALDANKVDVEWLKEHCDEYKFYMCVRNDEIVYVYDGDWIIYCIGGRTYSVSDSVFKSEYIV